MAKGAFQPAGVRCFGYKKQDSKGKFHPEAVNSGQAGAEFYEGQQPAITLGKGGSNSVPAGVKQNSGKEPLGAKVKHLNASHSGPAKTGTDAKFRPDGVRVFKDQSV